jgi:hypothetical protein
MSAICRIFVPPILRSKCPAFVTSSNDTAGVENDVSMLFLSLYASLIYMPISRLAYLIDVNYLSKSWYYSPSKKVDKLKDFDEFSLKASLARFIN